MLSVRIPLSRGVLDTPLCDQVCQRLAVGWWFSPDTPVSPTNKTDRHDIAEILLKVESGYKTNKTNQSYRKQEPFTPQGHITTITTAANENLGHAMDKPFKRMQTLNSVFALCKYNYLSSTN
jgi:hypothetical protein